MKTKTEKQKIKQLKRLSKISSDIVKAFAYFNGEFNSSNKDSAHDLIIAYEAINREFERIYAKL